ncbi:MAG: alcohol dehydrogenase catalytic domain-containing protein [Desulfobacteria bacterium]|nr:zinc-binding dehydrogenase [Deltaproteobacteria bacterium]
MKAARFYGVGRPLVVEDVPPPRPGPGDVLLKVKACGLCGSDIHIVYEGVTPTAFQPIILGHEFSGEIAETGKGVAGWKAGDRVAASCMVACGRCPNCVAGKTQICVQRRVLGVHLDGGLAEYARVPAVNLAQLDDRVPFTEGAILTDAVATPYRALTRRGRLLPGETIVVIGCGGLGLHAVQLARILGAGRIIGVDLSRPALERARKMGADRLVQGGPGENLAAIKDATDGVGVDLALDFVGAPETIGLAVECLRAGGRAVVVGLGAEKISLMPSMEFVRKEFELLGSYGFTVPEIEELVAFMVAGKLDLSGSVSRTVALEDVNEGLDALYRKTDDPIRIVVTM